MGKYTEERINGYILYYTTKCLKEGIIHVHSSKDRISEKSLAKLWVYEDGSSKLASPSSIPTKDLHDIQLWIRNNVDLIKEEWLSNNMGGTFKKK